MHCDIVLESEQRYGSYSTHLIQLPFQMKLLAQLPKNHQNPKMKTLSRCFPTGLILTSNILGRLVHTRARLNESDKSFD